MANKQLGLRFGAMCDSLNKQLRKQGFKFDKEAVSHFQKDADALLRMRFRGYITDTQIGVINKKLYKAIEKHIVEENDLVIKK